MKRVLCVAKVLLDILLDTEISKHHISRCYKYDSSLFLLILPRLVLVLWFTPWYLKFIFKNAEIVIIKHGNESEHHVALTSHWHRKCSSLSMEWSIWINILAHVIKVSWLAPMTNVSFIIGIDPVWQNAGRCHRTQARALKLFFLFQVLIEHTVRWQFCVRANTAFGVRGKRRQIVTSNRITFWSKKTRRAKRDREN